VVVRLSLWPRQSYGAEHGQPGRADTGSGRPVSHPAARLVIGLAVFVLLGWGVGELWTSAAGSLELDAMREVAAQRTAALTDVALVIVLAVAASRVYLGVHYPSDVVAGMLLGSGWAIYVSRCLREPKDLSQGSQAR
jgi:hypothetical protein